MKRKRDPAASGFAVDSDALRTANGEAPGVEGLLRAVAEAGRLLVGSQDFLAGLSAVVRALGELAGFDRAYAFGFDPVTESYRLIADWARPPWPAFGHDPVRRCLRVGDFLEIHAELVAGRVWKSHRRERTGANAAIHETAQTKSDALVPVLVRGALWGCVGFDRCTAIRDFSEGELDVLRTAAAMIAAAVGRERADRDKIEAVASERENAAIQRAAVLKSVGFLRGSLGSLAKTTDFNSALEVLLGELAQALGAAHVQLLRHDPIAKQLRLELSWLEGRVRWGLSGEELPLFAAPFADDITPAWEIMCRDRGLFTPDIRLPIPPEEFGWPGAFEYAARFELADMAHIVLFAGEEPVGSIALGFRNGRKLKLADRPLVEDAAQDAASLIRMLDLSRAAQQAAIAREREQAARQRADELVKANVALRATLAQLASQSDHKAFLGAVLIEASRQLNADAGHLAIVDEAQSQVITIAHCDGDHLRPLGEFPPVASISQVAALAAMEAEGGPRSFDLNREQHLFMPGTVEWHQQFGSRTVLAAPMILGKKVVGFLGFAFRRETVLTPEKGELLMALAQQAALATELIRVSQKERDAAIAREREQTAQERAEELAKANDGLQATVDATSQVLELDELVPKVLGIIGKVFETDNCAIFENRPSGEVRLWYWHTEGRTLLPAELLQLDEEKHSLVRRLAGGFTVPQEYLGRSPQMAGTALLDHVQGTIIPEFDRWAVSIGCDLELNIGIASQGVRCATLCVYRPRLHPFSPREIVLAEALARQIGLALQVTKLSQANLEAAVIREREQAALRRAKALAKANLALAKSSGLLAGSGDLKEFIRFVAIIIADLLNIEIIDYWNYSPDCRRAAVTMRFKDGRWLSESDVQVHPGASGYEMYYDDADHKSVRERSIKPIVRRNAPDHPAHAPLADWLRSEGIETILLIPLRLTADPMGVLALCETRDRVFNAEELELAEVLGNQAALAIHIGRLAEQSKISAVEAAVTREREQAAQERAEELERLSRALQETIDSFGKISDLDELVPVVLRIVARTLGAISCSVFEHRSDHVFLKFLFMEGRVLVPQEMLALDGEKFGLIRRLAAGFTAPVDYLGTTVQQRTRAVVLDHASGTSAPEFDDLARNVGWDLELNVPIVSEGRAIGALCVYRSSAAGAFTPREIRFAESLSAQLAMAMLAKDLAAQAQDRAIETVIAREREQATSQRADEAEAVNLILEGLIAASRSLLDEADLSAGLQRWLASIAQAVGADYARLGSFAAVDEKALIANIRTEWMRPGLPKRDRFEVPATTDFVEWAVKMTAGETIFAHFEDLKDPASKRFWELTNCASNVIVPVIVERRTIGWMSLDWRVHHELKQSHEMILRMGAAAVAAAVKRDDLVQAMIAEREAAVLQRADELAKANDLLRRVNERLAYETNYRSVLGLLLAELSSLVGSDGAAIYSYDAGDNSLHFLLGLDDGRIVDDIVGHPFGRAGDPAPVRLFPAWPDLVRSRSQQFLRMPPDSSTPPGNAWHHARGHRLLVQTALVANGEPLGLLGLAFTSDAELDPSKLELFNAVAQQATLALQLNRLSDQARHADVARERETTILQERTRFAGQIHDTLAQGFTGTLLHLEALRVRVARGERVTVEELQGVRKIAALGLAEARRSALAIRPLALDGRDLSTALLQLTERSAVPGLLDCRWSLGGIPRPLSPIVDESLLNIAHEAVSNAIRHADASHIHITLAFDPDGVSLHIRDDGIGFDASDSRQRGHTFGLRSMHERAGAVGGKLNVISKHGEGTTVTVHLRTG